MLCCCCYFRLEEIEKLLQEDIERGDDASDGENEDNANGDGLLEEHRSLQLQNQLNVDLLCLSNLFPPTSPCLQQLLICLMRSILKFLGVEWISLGATIF